MTRRVCSRVASTSKLDEIAAAAKQLALLLPIRESIQQIVGDALPRALAHRKALEVWRRWQCDSRRRSCDANCFLRCVSLGVAE